ncbi:MAG TPA: hypothetical protein VNX88_12915 [Terriglobales bacterium]|jgi:hypothetical protein|nr:hypothetical protein [Terriglobales bacterium]
MANIRGNVQTLLASAARTTSGTSAVLNLPNLMGGGVDGAQFLLNVSAISAGTTLDVFLQHSPDAGTTFYDFGHFAQVTSTTASGVQAMLWTRRDNDGTGGTAVIATGDAALAASKVLNGPIADNYFRVKWTLAGTSYTFALTGVLDRD